MGGVGCQLELGFKVAVRVDGDQFIADDNFLTALRGSDGFWILS